MGLDTFLRGDATLPFTSPRLHGPVGYSGKLLPTVPHAWGARCSVRLCLFPWQGGKNWELGKGGVFEGKETVASLEVWRQRGEPGPGRPQFRV